MRRGPGLLLTALLGLAILQPATSATPAPTFTSSIRYLSGADHAAMTGVSWHEGCPVGLPALRKVAVSRHDFKGRVLNNGILIVHKDHARRVVEVFRKLFNAKFPIPRMRTVEAYGGDDGRSMADNNTSAFNCREVTGRPGVFSEHSYGWAIDINPVQNPYVNGSTVLPKAGEAYTDRSQAKPGMIHGGDVVVDAFEVAGWEWGGYWTSLKDYHHFSATNR